MSVNPIRYSSRTFQTILNDINTDPELTDKPDWFKRMVAGVGDVLSMINNAQANDSLLPTAFTRRAVIGLCRLIGYELPQGTASSGTMLFYLASATVLPIIVQRADLAAATRGSVAVAARRFEARAASTVVAETATINLATNPIASNQIVVARAFLTGETVLITCSGTMPTGLTSGQTYFVIYVNATHIKLAATQALALLGTALTISGGSGSLSLALRSFRATCYQQEDKGDLTLGTSDGISSWQEFALPDLDVLEDSLTVTVNGVEWEVQESLAQSLAADKHFVHEYKADGSSVIYFGNGTFGAIPSNFDVIANYAVGGGAASNVSVIGGISIYAGADEALTGCMNATAFTGGADAQSIEVAKRIAPGTLRARDRFVTVEDGEALALGYGGIAQAVVIANVYGTLSAQVVAVASGGGNPSTPVRAALQAYLISKSILSSMDVRVTAATITSTAATSAAKMLPGYVWASVLPYFRLAWKLLLADSGQEVLDAYLSEGVAAAVVLINLFYTEAFTSADYSEVTKVLDSLDRYGARQFGDTVAESDAFAFIQGGVDGIDYMTSSAPTFPIVNAADEITDYGTLTLTEI